MESFELRKGMISFMMLKNDSVVKTEFGDMENQ